MDILEAGCSFAQIITKINDIVTWINSFSESPVSYNDLIDKPKIDGVELSSTTSMANFQLQLAQFPNEAAIVALFDQIAQAKAAEVAAATAVSEVQKTLAVETAKTAGIQPQDSFKIFFFAKNEADEEVRYSLTLDELAEYVNSYINSQRTVVGG